MTPLSNPSLDIEAIREAAEKATPGERFWALDKCNQCANLMTRAGDYVLSPQVDVGDYGLTNDCWIDLSKEDEAFIAAANPQAVLSLIAHLKAAEAREAELIARCDALVGALGNACFALEDASRVFDGMRCPNLAEDYRTTISEIRAALTTITTGGGADV